MYTYVYCVAIVPPTVSTESLVIVVRGESATLDCTVSGIPAPSVQWIRNKKKISSERNVTIESADLEDEGQYVCIGENKGGRANSTITVDIHCKYTASLLCARL